jgi:hypothetical protein
MNRRIPINVVSVGVCFVVLFITTLELLAASSNTSNSQIEFRVTTKPDGAKVFIDNIYKGNTPIAVKDVGAGKHKVTISKAGYLTWEKEGTIDKEHNFVEIVLPVYSYNLMKLKKLFNCEISDKSLNPGNEGLVEFKYEFKEKNEVDDWEQVQGVWELKDGRMVCTSIADSALAWRGRHGKYICLEYRAKGPHHLSSAICGTDKMKARSLSEYPFSAIIIAQCSGKSDILNS